VWDQPAAIEFSENPAQTDFRLQGAKSLGDSVGAADQRVGAHGLLIIDTAELLDPPHAPSRGLRVDKLGRSFEQTRLLLVKCMMLARGSASAALSVSAR